MRAIQTYDDPIMQDEVVQTLNALLANIVEYRFGIVHTGYDEDGNTYPSVYHNDGSFKNEMLFPDNKVKSFCFWEFESGDVLNDNDGDVYNLSFVFWGNLTRIDGTKLYDHTTEIQQSILTIFLANGARDVSWTQDDVFSNYSKYLEQEKQTLMRPNTGFRISFQIDGTGVVCI